MTREHRDVFAAVTERGNNDRQHIQPIEEVLAQLPLCDQLLQVALGGRDDPDVHGDWPGTAHAFNFAVLQGAEQFDLHRQWHVVDVVEEQRASLGQFEASGLVLHCPGERAAFVAEEFGFNQRV